MREVRGAPGAAHPDLFQMGRWGQARGRGSGGRGGVLWGGGLAGGEMGRRKGGWHRAVGRRVGRQRSWEEEGWEEGGGVWKKGRRWTGEQRVGRGRWARRSEVSHGVISWVVVDRGGTLTSRDSYMLASKQFI